MPYPDLYGVTYSYTGFQQAQGDNSFPGTQLDADLAGLQSSIFGVAAFVERGFRSDGALANGSVGYDQLSPSLQLAGISAASAWLTGTAYAVGAGVVQSQKFYRCPIAHTSGVFATDLAAGKWIFVANIGINNSGASVAGHLPVYADTSGVLLADSGIALSSLAPLLSPVFTTPNIGVATGTSLTLSGTLTVASLSFSALTVTGLVTIAPAANTTTQGLSVAQTLPVGSAGINNAYSANLISVVNSGYQTPAGGAADSFGLFPVVAGLRVNYTAAGSGLGNYPIHIGGLFATKATSVGQQLVGLNGTIYTNINSSGNDSFWSVIGYANIGPNANIGGIYGLEAEVATSAGATILYRIGVSAVSMGPTTGSTIDAAFAVTAQTDKYGAPAPWNNALVLWKSDGVTHPIGPSGSVIVTNDTFSTGYCINLPNVTFVSKIFDFGASVFQTDGSGNTIMGGGSLTLGVAGSNVGKTLFKNATSGTLTVQPPTGALGTVTNTLQAVNDTFVYRATTDTLTNKTIDTAGPNTIKVAGVDVSTAWTTYSPTASAQTPGATPPTFTSVTGRYKQTGKTIVAQMEAVINVAGTAAGSLLVSLPTASRAGDYVGSAFESAIAGKSGAAIILGGSDTANVRARDATGATFFANGATVTITIVYEIP